VAAVSVAARRRLVTTALAVLTCVGLAGGCSRAISGTATTSGTVAPATVAGLPVSDGPNGPKPGATQSTRPVDNTDGGETDKLAASAVSDLDDYWKQAFPQTFNGKQFTSVKRLVSYDSGAAPGIPLCNNAPSAGQVTVSYCAGDDSIAWDRGQLLPQLGSTFGPMGVVAAITHATGRAVEQRAGTVPANAPAIVAEQQADCFSGAFFRHVAEDSSPRLQLSTGAGLNQVMGSLSYIHDTPDGSSDATGSAFDRISAFQDGFSDGPSRCSTMDINEVKQRTAQTRFWNGPQNKAQNRNNTQDQDFPVTQDHLQTAEDSMQAAFRDTAAVPPAITSNPAACASTRPTSPAAYCPDTNTVSLNLPQLQQIATPPQKGKADTGYGNFAAYAEVASRYALSVEKAAGLSVDGDNAGLRTACLVGAWSGVLVDEPIGQRNPVGKLRITPGDVDTAMAALLSQNGLIAADAKGAQVSSGFARVQAFRLGFQQGLSPCTAHYS
jgi:predicted metalloprotease